MACTSQSKHSNKIAPLCCRLGCSKVPNPNRVDGYCNARCKSYDEYKQRQEFWITGRRPVNPDTGRF